jgi:hypothetical protein
MFCNFLQRLKMRKKIKNAGDREVQAAIPFLNAKNFPGRFFSILPTVWTRLQVIPTCSTLQAVFGQHAHERIMTKTVKDRFSELAADL